MENAHWRGFNLVMTSSIFKQRLDKTNTDCDVNHEAKFSEFKFPTPNLPSKAKPLKVTYTKNRRYDVRKRIRVK